MFLLFPESMMIPEVLERLRDSDFEDWLTTALIDSANRQSPREPNSSEEQLSPRGVTDLWMLEIAERTGNIWRGSFHVEFDAENNSWGENVSSMEPQEELMSFAIYTDTGEIKIDPR